MKFIIDRASIYDGPPCKGATKESCQRTEYNSNPAYPHPERMLEWNNSGYNHRMEGRYHVREVDDERWWIEVSTLAELLSMVDPENDGIIVSANNSSRYTDNSLTITIYDSYVE